MKNNKGSVYDLENEPKSVKVCHTPTSDHPRQRCVAEDIQAGKADKQKNEDEVHSEYVDDNGEVDGEATGDDGELDGEEEGHDGDRSEAEDLMDGIFATDTINDSALSDNDDASTTTTDQSVSEDISYQTDKTTARGDVKFASNVSSHAGTTSSERGDVHWENAEFLFDVSVLRKGDAPQTKCTYCGGEGHIVDTCTAEQVTRKLKPLPSMPLWFKEILTKVCICCRGKNLNSILGTSFLSHNELDQLYVNL